LIAYPELSPKILSVFYTSNASGKKGNRKGKTSNFQAYGTKRLKYDNSHRLFETCFTVKEQKIKVSKRSK
jgi:hypothetical protein